MSLINLNIKQGEKKDQGKEEMAYISSSLMKWTAKVRTFGAKKYTPDGWKDGFTFRRSMSALLRHAFAVNEGEDLDPESGLPHLAHLICNAEHLLYAWEHLYASRPELDDRSLQDKERAKKREEERTTLKRSREEMEENEVIEVVDDDSPFVKHAMQYKSAEVFWKSPVPDNSE